MRAICWCVCRCNLQYKCSLLFAHWYRRNLLYTIFLRLVAAEASSLKTSGACCFPHCEWDYVYTSFLCFHATLSTFTFYTLQPVWFGRDLCVRQITRGVTVSSPGCLFHLHLLRSSGSSPGWWWLSSAPGQIHPAHVYLPHHSCLVSVGGIFPWFLHTFYIHFMIAKDSFYPCPWFQSCKTYCKNIYI